MNQSYVFPPSLHPTPIHSSGSSQRIRPNALCYTAVSHSVQFSSLAQSCPTLCDLMNHSTPGLPVHHHLPEFTQTHAHRVGDAIQPSHPLSSPSPSALNPSQHQGPFQWVNSLHEVAKVLEFQLQHQSFQWTPRTDVAFCFTHGSVYMYIVYIGSVYSVYKSMPLSQFVPHVRAYWEGSVCKPGRKFSEFCRNHPVGPSPGTSQPPELWTHKPLWFKTPSASHLIIAAGPS